MNDVNAKMKCGTGTVLHTFRTSFISFPLLQENTFLWTGVVYLYIPDSVNSNTTGRRYVGDEGALTDGYYTTEP